MEDIKIVYIDDSPEIALSRYLDNYNLSGYNIEYSDVKFDPNEGYESLISNPNVNSANIIIIDSRLFENSNTTNGKFTGEEFKILLKKYRPFIEVILITQNQISDKYEILAKYDHRCGKTPEEYYNEFLPNLLEEHIKRICGFRNIAKIFEENPIWEGVLTEKIINSMNGQAVYDELTKNDIDEIITVFKMLLEAKG